MHGTHAFCPESGGSLSEDTVVTEDGQELRYSTGDNAYGDDSYILTTGSRCSSKIALMSRFRECHERHFGTRWIDEDRVAQLYRRVATHLRKLKAECNGETSTRDEWIWFALAERLGREGEPADWMHAHADQVCPNCGGQLQWYDALRGSLPKCVNDCYGDGRFVGGEICERVATVYNRAFGDDIGEGVKPTELEVVP